MANERLIFLACDIYSILAEYSLRRCTFRWGLWPMDLWLRYSVITKAALRSLLCIFLQWCFDGNLVFITILAFLRKFLSLVNEISLLTISPPDRLVSNRAGAQKTKQNKLSTQWSIKTTGAHSKEISLGIRPVWSVFSVSLKKVWILNYP